MEKWWRRARLVGDITSDEFFYPTRGRKVPPVCWKHLQRINVTWLPRRPITILSKNLFSAKVQNMCSLGRLLWHMWKTDTCERLSKWTNRKPPTLVHFKGHGPITARSLRCAKLACSGPFVSEAQLLPLIYIQRLVVARELAGKTSWHL